MSAISIFLFGKFTIADGHRALHSLHSQKVTELFCFLLLNRRSHSRELVADLLWGDQPTITSKKYLRKALWQLQSSLKEFPEPVAEKVLLVDPEWLQFNLSPAVWLDVSVLEGAFALTKGVRGSQFDPRQYQVAQEAVDLYRGDLLEGWYQDWCLLERERYKELILILLDKLIGYCEAHQDYESGVEYGHRILAIDRAHEKTHFRLMRLKYNAGDRTAGLRQFESCRAALHEELNAEPSENTLALYRQIQKGSPGKRAPTSSDASAASALPGAGRVAPATNPNGERPMNAPALADVRRLNAMLVQANEMLAAQTEILQRITSEIGAIQADFAHLLQP